MDYKTLITAGAGSVPDSVVAGRLNICRRSVCSLRKKHGIAAFVGFILTQEGSPCRSLYEAKYDAWLHWQGKEHVHEVPIPGTSYIADFVVDGRFVEIAGMVQYKRYREKHERKRKECASLGINVDWLSCEDVEKLYAGCAVKVQFRDRACSGCGVQIERTRKGFCASCYMKQWRQTDDHETADCIVCGTTFKVYGRNSNKCCTRPCYWSDIRGSYDWERIEKELETKSLMQIAREMNIGYPGLRKQAVKRGLELPRHRKPV